MHRTLITGLATLALLVVGCPGGDDDDTQPDDDVTTDDDTGDDDTQSDDDDTQPDDDDTGDDDTAGPFNPCPPLGPPTGNTITLGPDDVDQIFGTVANLAEGDTILLEDGTYDLDGVHLWIDVPGVTVRSASGDRDAVVLDGGYVSSQVIQLGASDVTVADLTLQRVTTHPIHVAAAEDTGTITGTRVYNVMIRDPGQQAIKINPNGASYADEGEIACSHIELTDEGRPFVDPVVSGCYTGGVDAHDAWGWTVRDNHIEGFWCPTGFSEHGIHFWSGCRDTVVERNVLVDNYRQVGFGLREEMEGRSYADGPCGGVEVAGHYGGVIRNNVIYASDPDLFASEYGYDTGISLNQSCGTQVLHNTVASTEPPYIGIEYRFALTDAVIRNNLVTANIRERDDGVAVEEGNLEDAPLDLFVDHASVDLHLAAGATDAIDQGVVLADGECDEDVDGDPRDGSPDIGADEVVAGRTARSVNGTLRPVNDHHVLHLWGTPEEMGYAHGTLLASEIMALANGYVLPMFGVDAGTYEMLLSAFGNMLDFPDDVRAEAEGLIDGIRDAGVSLEMVELAREITAEDLLLANAAADLFGVYFGCSSISAWGEATAGDASLGGETAMVRDLDWGYAGGDADLREYPLIIARDPADGGKQRWVSIGFPSYLGCLSCFNESGIGAFQNQGNTSTMLGDIDPDDTLVPIHLSMRGGIETRDHDGDGEATIHDVVDAVTAVGRIGTYEVHLISPVDRSDPPAAILEADHGGWELRVPADDPLPHPDCVATTNHHRELHEAEYCDRYATIVEMVDEYGGELTLDRLWEIETETSWNSWGSGTIHTMRVVPADLTLEVAFADTDNVAPLNPITAYDMATLFEDDGESADDDDDDPDDGCACRVEGASTGGATTLLMLLALLLARRRAAS